MGWLIIIGSIPIVVLGLLFQDQIETVLRSMWVVAIMLIFFGILLGIADYVGAKRRKLDQITYPHGILFGFAQALALIPGVSRSGGTITMGLFLGYERAAAARYAFLLAIPAVFGSGFFQLFKSWDAPDQYFSLGETVAATGIAFVVALGVIAFFMNWISKRSFLPFVIYRILLGVTLLILLSMGVISG
jgi:undecaprenyl-diphosphatase